LEAATGVDDHLRPPRRRHRPPLAFTTKHAKKIDLSRKVAKIPLAEPSTNPSMSC
jgi:hypothetical protein